MKFQDLVSLLDKAGKEAKKLGLNNQEIQNMEIVKIKMGSTEHCDFDITIGMDADKYYLLIKENKT